MSPLKLGVLYSRLRPEEKWLFQAIERRTDVELVPLESRKLVLAPGSAPEVDVVLDREVSQSRASASLRMLASAGVPTVNAPEVVRTCDDKLRTSHVLRRAGVPTPEVRLAFTPASARRAIDELGYPVVLKPVDGSWGRLMAKVTDPATAEAVLEHKTHLGAESHRAFYVQAYIAKPERDIRAYVIDDEPIAAAYRTASDWRTNAARGAVPHPCGLTPELRELCVRASRAVGGGALAVDLMETPDGFTVHEVNSAMEFKGSLHVLDVDLPSRLIDYCLGRAGDPRHR
ncbi:MAG: lysine biosynthesis protein LysX [Candidatus Bipolaricaulia bacterium]